MMEIIDFLCNPPACFYSTIFQLSKQFSTLVSTVFQYVYLNDNSTGFHYRITIIVNLFTCPWYICLTSCRLFNDQKKFFKHIFRESKSLISAFLKGLGHENLNILTKKDTTRSKQEIGYGKWEMVMLISSKEHFNNSKTKRGSCAAHFSLLNLPKGKSLGRSKPATNS